MGLERDARTAVLHVQRVSDADDARLERQRAAAPPVADDRVHDLGGDDGALGVVVDVREQAVEQVGGEEQAERLMVDAVDRHAEVVQQAGAGDHDFGVATGSWRSRRSIAEGTPARWSRRKIRSALLSTICRCTHEWSTCRAAAR